MQQTVTSMGILWSGYLAPLQTVTMLFWPFQDAMYGQYKSEPSIWAQATPPWTNWARQYWFTITPVNPPGFRHLVPYDQHVGITTVSWIRKGSLHELDMSGGAGDLLLELTARNYGNDPANFDVWLHQADVDLWAKNR
jgi:hypothetical protein